ncbi:hypothetical protein L6164_027819 [Bauhinia variegata]|uniref:Uncharacterized protein n=1 Tax=Bauhinia variegata TaxID=167791 RepID=A0ACB9LUG9_BAUVA|nr:hypothetical protein L6164_027819 [Bauhinia variegata]
MSETHAPPSGGELSSETDTPPFLISQQPPLPLNRLRSAPLYKQRSWSPDVYREEAWLRRKGNWKNRRMRSKSVTDEDVDELKACIELGFGFDSSPEVEIDQRLSDTLPALGLYFAVNKNYNDSLVVSNKTNASSSSSTVSDCETSSPLGSPHTAIIGPGDNPQTVKTRLRQWAQVVACASPARIHKEESTNLLYFHQLAKLWYCSSNLGVMDCDRRRKPSDNLLHSRFFLSGFYCWGWEFLTALLLFSSSS